MLHILLCSCVSSWVFLAWPFQGQQSWHIIACFVWRGHCIICLIPLMCVCSCLEILCLLINPKWFHTHPNSSLDQPLCCISSNCVHLDMVCTSNRPIWCSLGIMWQTLVATHGSIISCDTTNNYLTGTSMACAEGAESADSVVAEIDSLLVRKNLDDRISTDHKKETEWEL